jgi:hypothetical protein
MFAEAHLRNRRLHLIGRNSAGCCDMFDFTLDAVAIQLPSLASSHDYEGVATSISHTPYAVPEPHCCASFLFILAGGILAARPRRQR